MTLATRFRVSRTRALLGLAYAAPIVVLLALLLGEKKASIAFGVREREGVREHLKTAPAELAARNRSGIHPEALELASRLGPLLDDYLRKSNEFLTTLDALVTHADADSRARAAEAGRAAEVLGERLWTLAASELNDMLESRITALSRRISRVDCVTYPSLPHVTCV